IETICRYNLPVCIVIFNNAGIYRGTELNPAGADPAITVFVKGSRYDRMIEAFGGVGMNATTPDELKRAVDAAMDSGRPTLINAVIDPAAGTESGSIGKLNPQSAVRKKYRKSLSEGLTDGQGTRRGSSARLHTCSIGSNVYAVSGLAGDRRRQGGTRRRK